MIQETLGEALANPSTPRVCIHVGACGGWVLFEVAGGFCLSCGAGPLKVTEYAKPRPA